MKNIQAVLVLLLIIGTSAAAQTKAADSKIVFTAALTAAQESPADTSHATGTAWAVLSEDSRQLTYHVTYARLTSKFAASHFHIGSSGTPGPVVQPIKFSGNTASGTWTNIPDSVMAALLRGGIYINVHSSNYPAGEIRGQLKPAGGIPFVISLDPMQVTSAVTSEASGTGWAVLNKSDSALTLTYGITIAGLSSAYAASHFHMGAAGQSGGVIQPITFTDSSAYGTWSKIPDADILSLLKNGLYVNVHSSNY
ncbi:MAG: CHRD domain-containing protein, partial [Syntrophothermus sp.]